jgi:hypothetical protein
MTSPGLKNSLDFVIVAPFAPAILLYTFFGSREIKLEQKMEKIYFF